MTLMVTQETPLHPRLEADTRQLATLRDCRVRWMDDQRFPWLVVIPATVSVQQWYELEQSVAHGLLALVNRCAAHLGRITGADRINVGELGNLVPQLHIHVVARFRHDSCWPGPVWGQGMPIRWPTDEVPHWVAPMRSLLTDSDA